MVAPSKLSIARLTPSAMAPEHTEHAVALVHHVLPSLRLSFLRRFIRNKDVHTLVLLLPEELLSKGDGSKEDARSDEEDEGDAEDEGDEEEDAEDDESEDDDGDSDDEAEEGGGSKRACEGATKTPEEAAAYALMRRRIAGVVSYECGERLGQRLLQVSLLAVRIRYQRLGVASKLVRSLLNGEAASFGRPDAAIAWADARAIDFFKRHGFSDDPMLNARYREVSAPWNRATLMSLQLPPLPPDLNGAASASTAVASWVAAEPLHEQLEAWRKARLLEYSNELSLIERLHAEIRMLRDKVAVHHGHAAVLQAENAKLKRENAALAAEFEQYRRARAQASSTAAAAAATASLDLTDDVSSAIDGVGDGGRHSAAAAAAAAAAADWIAAQEAEAAAEAGSPSSRRTTRAAVPPHAWSHDELQAELDKSKPSAAAAPATTRLRLRRWDAPSAPSAAALRARHEACRAQLSEPSLVLRLFYGAPASELQQILLGGFDDVPADPHGLGVYGRGWYFSKYAAHAHHYTGGGGALLLVDVAVGNTETVVRRDVARGAPSEGYDSIVVPGRRLPSQAGDGASADVNEEYVIFDGSQAVPLCLIHYEVDVA